MALNTDELLKGKVEIRKVIENGIISPTPEPERAATEKELSAPPVLTALRSQLERLD